MASPKMLLPLLLAAFVAVLVGNAAAEDKSGSLMPETTSILRAGKLPASATANQRTTATCASLRSSGTCKPFNSRTIDSSTVPAKGRYTLRYRTNPPTDATLLGSPKASVIAGGLAVVVSAAAFKGTESDPEFFAITTSVYLPFSGCKFTTATAADVDSVIVWSASYSCSGKYLVAP